MSASLQTRSGKAQNTVFRCPKMCSWCFETLHKFPNIRFSKFVEPHEVLILKFDQQFLLDGFVCLQTPSRTKTYECDESLCYRKLNLSIVSSTNFGTELRIDT